jgi:hypothetical protein
VDSPGPPLPGRSSRRSSALCPPSYCHRHPASRSTPSSNAPRPFLPWHSCCLLVELKSLDPYALQSGEVSMGCDSLARSPDAAIARLYPPSASPRVAVRNEVLPDENLFPSLRSWQSTLSRLGLRRTMPAGVRTVRQAARLTCLSADAAGIHCRARPRGIHPCLRFSRPMEPDLP